MGRPCWICGAPDGTEEHVWPEWLKKIATSPVGKTRFGIVGDPSTWHEWTGGAFEHTSRVLCKRCNRRLGELEEGPVAQLIPAMVGGQSMRLSGADQEMLAQWMYKTGLMVSTTNRHEASALPKAHYAELEQSLDLPPASAVWIAQIQDPAYEAALWLQRFQWRDRAVEDAPDGEGYILAISVRDVMGLVASLDDRQSPESTDFNPFVLGGLAQGRLLRIWPVSDHFSVVWPPPSKLTSAEFDHLAKSLQQLSSEPAG